MLLEVLNRLGNLVAEACFCAKLQQIQQIGDLVSHILPQICGTSKISSVLQTDETCMKRAGNAEPDERRTYSSRLSGNLGLSCQNMQQLSSHCEGSEAREGSDPPSFRFFSAKPPGLDRDWSAQAV